MMDQMMNFLLRLLPFLKITLIIAVSSMIVGLVWGGDLGIHEDWGRAGP